VTGLINRWGFGLVLLPILLFTGFVFGPVTALVSLSLAPDASQLVPGVVHIGLLISMGIGLVTGFVSWMLATLAGAAANRLALPVIARTVLSATLAAAGCSLVLASFLAPPTGDAIWIMVFAAVVSATIVASVSVIRNTSPVIRAR